MAMGFPTLPPETAFCAGAGCCNTVYGIGETPLKLYASFVGIKMGTAVPGVDPPPPNKTYELVFHGNCNWRWQELPDNLSLSLDNPVSQLLFSSAPPLNYFKDFPGGLGVSYYVNDQLNPAVDTYYEGTCKIVSTVLGGEEVIPNAMADIAMEPAVDTFFDFTPVTDDLSILRFSRRWDKTNIHIKYDNS